MFVKETSHALAVSGHPYIQGEKMSLREEERSVPQL